MLTDQNKKVILLIAKATGSSLKDFNNLSPELLAQAQEISKIIDKVRSNTL